MKGRILRERSPYLDTGLLAVGACLLCMPTVSVLDLLPTFLGYALIARGLYRLADMNEDVAHARRLMWRMSLLGLARALSVLWIFGFVSAGERPVTILLVSFSLLVLDAITLIPAMRGLSGGLIYLASRRGGEAVLSARPRGRRGNRTEHMAAVTLRYLIAKDVLAVLPELSVLTSEQSGATVNAGDLLPHLYDFIGLMRGTCLLISLVWGVTWLIRLWGYIRHVAADKPFFEHLWDHYESTVLTRPDLFAKRRVKAGMTCLLAAFVCTFDFFIDGVNVIPDVIPAVLWLVGLCLIRRYVSPRPWQRAAVAVSLYLPVSAVLWIMQMTNVPMSRNYAAGVFRDGEVAAAYNGMVAVHILSCLAFLAALWLTVCVLKDAIRRYTGFSVTARDSADPAAHVRALHEGLYLRLYVVMALGAVAAVTSVIYVFTLPMAGSSILWEMWGLVDAVAHLAFAVSFLAASGVINEQIEYKYMLS